MTTYTGYTYTGNDYSNKSNEKVKSLLDTVLAKRNEFGRSTIDLTQNKIDWEHSDGDTVDILPSTVEVANGITEPLKLRLHAGQGQSLDTYETSHGLDWEQQPNNIKKLDKQRESLAATRNEDSWFPWTKISPEDITNQDIYTQGEKGKELLKAKLLGQNTLELGDLKQDPTLYNGKLSKRQIADVYDSSGSNIIDSLNTPENNVDYNSRFNSLGKLKNDLQKPTLGDTAKDFAGTLLTKTPTVLGNIATGTLGLASASLNAPIQAIGNSVGGDIGDVIKKAGDIGTGYELQNILQNRTHYAKPLIDALPISDEAKDTLNNLKYEPNRLDVMTDELYQSDALAKSRQDSEYRSNQTQRLRDELGYKPKGVYENAMALSSDVVDSLQAFVENPRATLTHDLPANIAQLFVPIGVTGRVVDNIAMKVASKTPGGVVDGVITQVGKDAATKYISSAPVQKQLLAIGGLTEGTQAASSIVNQAEEANVAPSQYLAPAITGGVITGLIGTGSNKLFGATAADALVGVNRVKGSAFTKALKAITSESLIEEFPQSANEQLATNIALGKENVMEGVGQAAGSGAIVGGLLGGGTHTPTLLQDALQARKTSTVEPTPIEAVDVPKTEDLTPSKPSIDEYKAKVETITDDNRQEVINQGIKDYPVNGTLPEKIQMASAISKARDTLESPEHDEILKQLNAEIQLQNFAKGMPNFKDVISDPNTSIEDIQDNLVTGTSDSTSINTGSLFNDIGRTKDEDTLNILKDISTAKQKEYAESDKYNDPYVLAKTGIETKNLPKESSEVFSAITRGESLDLNQDLLLLSSHVKDITGTEEQKNTGISALTKTISKVYSDKVDITSTTERTVKQALNTINGLVTNKGTITIEPRDTLEQIHNKILPTFGSQPIENNGNEKANELIKANNELFTALEEVKKDKTTDEVAKDKLDGEGLLPSYREHLMIARLLMAEGASKDVVNNRLQLLSDWVAYDDGRNDLFQELAAHPEDKVRLEEELKNYQKNNPFTDTIHLTHTFGNKEKGTEGSIGLARQMNKEAKLMSDALITLEKEFNTHFGITPEVTPTTQSTSQTDEDVLDSTNVNIEQIIKDYLDKSFKNVNPKLAKALSDIIKTNSDNTNLELDVEKFLYGFNKEVGLETDPMYKKGLQARNSTQGKKLQLLNKVSKPSKTKESFYDTHTLLQVIAKLGGLTEESVSEISDKGKSGRWFKKANTRSKVNPLSLHEMVEALQAVHFSQITDSKELLKYIENELRGVSEDLARSDRGHELYAEQELSDEFDFQTQQYILKIEQLLNDLENTPWLLEVLNKLGNREDIDLDYYQDLLNEYNSRTEETSRTGNTEEIPTEATSTTVESSTSNEISKPINSLVDIINQAVAVIHSKKGDDKYIFLSSQKTLFNDGLVSDDKQGTRVKEKVYKGIKIIADYFTHKDIKDNSGKDTVDILFVDSLEDAQTQFDNYISGGAKQFTNITFKTKTTKPEEVITSKDKAPVIEDLTPSKQEFSSEYQKEIKDFNILGITNNKKTSKLKNFISSFVKGKPVNTPNPISEMITGYKESLFTKYPKLFKNLFNLPEFTIQTKEGLEAFNTLKKEESKFQKAFKESYLQEEFKNDPLMALTNNAILDNENRFDPNIVSAMFMGSIDWLMNKGSDTLFNFEKDVQSILSMDENIIPQNEISNALSELGSVRAMVATGLGNNIFNLMKFTASKTYPENEIAKLKLSLGLHALNTLNNMGYVTYSAVENSTFDRFKLNEVLNPKVTTQLKPSELQDQSVVFVRIASDIEDMKSVINYSLKQTLDTLKAGSKDITAMFESAYEKELPRTKKPNKASVLASLGFNEEKGKKATGLHTTQEINDWRVDAVTKYVQTPHTLDTPTMKLYLAMNEDARAEMELGIDFQEQKQQSKERSFRGKVLSYEKEKEALEKLLELSEQGSKPLYFMSTFWNQGRIGGIGVGHPQNNKWIRNLSSPKNYFVKIKPSDEFAVMQFKLAVLEAFGVAAKSLTKEQIDPEFQEILTANEEAIKQINLQKEGKEFNQRTIINAVHKGKEKAHTLNGLVALSMYSPTEEFETNIGREVDGITNGVLIGLVLLAGVDNFERMKDVLAAAGLFEDPTMDYATWKNSIESKEDNYEQIARVFAESLNQAEQTPQLLAIKHFIGDLLVDDKVTKQGRNFAKPILLLTMFGKSTDKLATSVGDTVIATFYDELEKLHRDTELEWEDKVAKLDVIKKQIQTILGKEKLEGNWYVEGKVVRNEEDNKASLVDLTMENLLEFSLTQQDANSIIATVNHLFQPMIEEAINHNFGVTIDNRKILNDAYFVVGETFKLGLKKELLRFQYEQYIKLHPDNLHPTRKQLDHFRVNEGKEPSAEQMDKIIADLIKIQPRSPTKNSESLEQDLQLWNSERSSNHTAAYRTQTGWNSKTGKLKYTVTDKDGEVHIEELDLPKSTKAHALSLIINSLGVGVTIANIHNRDSNVMIDMMKSKFKGLAVHDAFIFNLLEAVEGSKLLNSSLIDSLNSFDVFQGAVDNLERVQEYVKANPDIANELNTGFTSPTEGLFSRQRFYTKDKKTKEITPHYNNLDNFVERLKANQKTLATQRQKQIWDHIPKGGVKQYGGQDSYEFTEETKTKPSESNKEEVKPSTTQINEDNKPLDSTKYSKTESKLANVFTLNSLKEAFNKVYGSTWFSALENTGKVKIINSEEADKIIHKQSLFHRVWHGTPHDFDRFDSSKINTGEGAQIFGYGLYFTEVQKIAEWYRDTLSKNKQTKIIVPHTLNLSKETVYFLENMINNFQMTADELIPRAKELESLSKKALEEATQEYENFISKTELPTDPDDLEYFSEYLDDLTNGVKWGKEALAKNTTLILDLQSIDLQNDLGISSRKKVGKLFEVELSPNIEEYLQWDKPLSEQSQFIQDRLKSKRNESGESLYKQLSAIKKGDKEASKFLRQLGIRGIKYRTESTHRDDSKDFNYVIFDDSDIEIIMKYSKNGTVQAFYNPDTGITYFVADNIDKDTDLKKLMLHELGVHALHLGLADTEFQTILSQIENQLMNPTGKIKEALNAANKANTPKEALAEEVLGYLVENYPNLSISQKIVAWFKEQIRSLFPSQFKTLSEQDFVYLASKALNKAPNILSNKPPKFKSTDTLGSTPNAKDLLTEKADLIKDITAENIVSEFDAMSKGEDETHNTFLRNFVSQVIAPVVEQTELLLFSKATYTYGQYSAELKKVAINLGQAMSKDLDKFQMSAQEVFAHEFTHAVTWAAYGLYDNKHIRNIVDTLFYKLEHEFNKYKARHPEDRSLDKWDGYVFNNKSFIDVTVHSTTTGKPMVVTYNRGIQEFLAFGSTNKEFRELLTKLKPRQLKVTEVSASTVSDEVREATWIEVISNVLKKVLDSFIRLAKGKNSLDPLIIFDKNVRLILAANGKAGYLNTTVPIVDRGDAFISEKAKDAGLGVLKFVSKGRGSKIQIIDSFGKYAGTLPSIGGFETNKVIRETIKLIKHEPTRNLLLDTINDIKGTTETNKPLENAILNKDTIEGKRNTATAKDVQEYQKKVGVLTDLQDTAFKNVVLSGELFSVRDNYPTNFIKLLEDKSELNQEIKTLELQIPKLVNDTKNLASMMVLGKYTETGLGKHNAALVAKQGRNIPQDKYQKELDLVTKLSRLYAIGLQDVNQVNEVVKLLKDKPQAMNEVMNVHRENVRKAHEEGHALTIHDGEIPTSNNPFRSIHLGTKEDEKFLVEHWGATIIGNLERDPNDPLTTSGVLYLITEKTQQDYDSKAMAFVSRNSESSNFHSGFVMTDKFKAAENREKAKLKDDGTKLTNDIKQKNNSNVSRVAIFNQQGKVIRYEYVLDKATKDKYLKPTVNAFKDLATQKNAITYINEAIKLNKQLVDKLYNYWKELGHKAKKDMIWVGSDGKYKDLWNMIPTETKAYFETKFGTTKGFYMAEEELRTVFGYRKQTITNWIQPVLEDDLKRHIGNHIYYMAKRLGFNLATITAMESMWIEGISFAKDTIVVKSGVVTAANESSNFMSAKLEGMPIPFYYQSKIRAMKAEQQFRRDSDALLSHLSNAYGNPEYVTDAIHIEMEKLKSAITNNPMAFLHEEGLASTIAEENAHKDKHETKLYSKTERARNLFDKLPKVVKDTLKVATISEGTKIYTLMNEIAQMGDITSRFALIEWEAEKAKRSGTKFDYESAIDKAKFLFIQYHSVTNDKVQWGNDIGLIMFSKFGTKAIGVLAHMFGNHAGRLLALGILEDVLGASDWIWNTSLNKFAIPTSSLYAAIDASPIANALITPPAYMPKELFSKLGILPVVSGM